MVIIVSGWYWLAIGKVYELPITNGTINSNDFFSKIKCPDGEPTRFYDPGYKETVNWVRFLFYLVTWINQ